MLNWTSDGELFAVMKRELYSAVVGDILDQMQRFHQFLPQRLAPLHADMTIAGRAMPVLEADDPGLRPGFGRMLEALDDLRPGEIYLCAGASPTYALVGEIMCTRMKALSAAGSVACGFHRDTRGILALDFPCFSYGAYAQDQAPRGKVLDYRVPIEIEGVRVNPGDLMLGDRDGVVVVPREIEREVIVRAHEKATGEKTVGNAVRDGMSATEAFTKYGIL